MSTRKLTVFTLMVFFAMGGAIMGCGEAPKQAADDAQANTEVSMQDVEGSAVASRKETIKKIFYTIPAPVEMASLIQSTGADFNGDNLNSVDNVNNYVTRKQKAINLGVYGANLSYATMFERSKESLYYLSAVRQLADQLGASNVINDDLITRVEANKENKDSLLVIVSDTFWSLNAKFKEDNMEDISALVIAGGWIEALHLANSHVAGNDALRTRVAEQKYSLDDLISLFGTYENQENLADVLADLNQLKTVFDQVEIKKGKTETSQDESGTTVIGGANVVSMSDATLQQIINTTRDIRSRYIQ
ncbi:MAG: hypothetical protein ACFCUH_00195 [Flavobacteriales bacterium]